MIRGDKDWGCIPKEDSYLFWLDSEQEWFAPFNKIMDKFFAIQKEHNYWITRKRVASATLQKSATGICMDKKKFHSINSYKLIWKSTIHHVLGQSGNRGETFISKSDTDTVRVDIREYPILEWSRDSNNKSEQDRNDS